jgi:hypothetical protein
MENDNNINTSYNWCINSNIRVLDVGEWYSDLQLTPEEYFFEKKITKDEFIKHLSKCKVKSNSLQRKTDKYLEYRMYGLVAYQLCGTIHAGIQFGHAVVEYQQNTLGLEPMQKIYNKWAKEDKTFIILNGGTTNRNRERLGTLNKHLKQITEMGVKVGIFFEPDLGDQLTAFVFLVDERVFNRELYPDFQEEKLPYGVRKPSKKVEVELEERNEANYQKWVEKIGGPKNAFLREFLKPLRLA